MVADRKTRVDPRRVHTLNSGDKPNGPVIHIMARDHRVEDNWALLFAQQIAVEHEQPLIVACPIAADYPDAPRRQTEFLQAGLREVGSDLEALNIPLVVALGPAAECVAQLAEEVAAGALICDFSPLRESRRWKAELADRLEIPFFEVDAHNIIPAWEASDKLEYAAYTIRPKIHRKLPEFLTSIPAPMRHPFPADVPQFRAPWSTVAASADGHAPALQGLDVEPGSSAAERNLERFISERMERYDGDRNDPTRNGQSNLSPYLHFGQLSAQRVALEAQRHDVDIASQEAFLEELIVRRELSDNFCLNNDLYDAFAGFPAWAQKTLDEHRLDPRPYIYDRDTLEAAETHDDLWNAAQREMVTMGKMHGYMRMYWAKKILEWSPSPEDALASAIYLNNMYELDGHDPNGYAGIAWSIGGVHDRAWNEREIFGKIRYMSAAGCKRKFRVDAYIHRLLSPAGDSSA